MVMLAVGDRFYSWFNNSLSTINTNSNGHLLIVCYCSEVLFKKSSTSSSWAKASAVTVSAPP